MERHGGQTDETRPYGTQNPFSIPTLNAGAIRTWRITPSLQHSITPRAVGDEDEDDDENEAILAPSSDEH